jgi:hypothetical protein
VGLAFETLIDAMEQVRSDGLNHSRPHRHQRFDLEGDEPLFEQQVVVGVEKTPEWSGERKGIQTIPHHIVLNLR